MAWQTDIFTEQASLQTRRIHANNLLGTNIIHPSDTAYIELFSPHKELMEKLLNEFPQPVFIELCARHNMILCPLGNEWVGVPTRELPEKVLKNMSTLSCTEAEELRTACSKVTGVYILDISRILRTEDATGCSY